MLSLCNCDSMTTSRRSARSSSPSSTSTCRRGARPPRNAPARHRMCRNGRGVGSGAVRSRLAVAGNPPRYGGRNAGVLEQFVHREELSRRRIYHAFNPQGVGIVAASCSLRTEEEQKATLGGTHPARGDDGIPRHERAGRRLRTWRACHPRCRRRRPFVVNGQGRLDLGRARRRRDSGVRPHDPDAPKHKWHQRAAHPDGHARVISTVRLRVRQNDLDFNEVFLTDVEVPPRIVGPCTADGRWPTAHSATNAR